MTKGLLLSAVALGFSSLAWAQTSGLVAIPVADPIGFREFEIGYGVSGTERSISRGYGHGAYGIFGVHERLELAAATDFLGGHVWSFKARLWSDAEDRFALGAGMQNINGRQSEPFVMGRLALEAASFHLGWYRDSASRACLGFDLALGERWVFGADHFSGSGGATSTGLWYDLGAGFTLSGALGYPNTRSDGVTHSFGLSYAARF